MKNWIWMLLTIALAGFSTQPATADSAPEQTGKQKAHARLSRDTTAAIELIKKTDPQIAKLFESAAGYVVFPSIGKGEVFAKGGQLIGTATMTQITIGFQLGGQKFSEVIFFEIKDTLDAFARGQWAMAAQATAVAAADGAAATAKYDQGVMVFTAVKGGLMFEASIGGQKFNFIPLKDVPLY